MATTNPTETRTYRVIPEGSRGVTVTVTGSYQSADEWRAAARDQSGHTEVDASFEAERVIRTFAWWLQ